jgi:hypothetical protein
MAEIINIQNLDPNTFEFQEYSVDDTSLITSNVFETTFDPKSDYIEYFIYDLNNTILYSNEIGYPNYTLEDNQLFIDPVSNLQTQGFTEGEYNTLYNFYTPKLGSSSLNKYYISEISSDRTEIRLDTTSIPNGEVISTTNDFISQIQNSSNGYLDFYLNFGSNQSLIANNVLLDTSDSNNPTVLIKLYEPLPTEFLLKTECWVVEQVAESVAYNISLFQTFDIEDENIKLKGPNLNIGIKDQINNTTEYTSYNTLSNTTSQQGTGSFIYQINSLLAEKGIEINVDYTDYFNFVYMSSAQTRLENFYYKLSLIEQYQASSSLSTGTTTNYYVSSSNIIWQNKIDEIITNFDGYEYYLYYESGSKAWPKTNSVPPYVNSSANSVAGLAFLTTQSATASLYDSENDNALVNSIPTYLREDPDNAQYELFVEMLAQMFDNIYLYIGDISSKYNADNRLNYGVSKDLVADVLRDLGVKIYQNNFSSNDLYTALLGLTNSGSLFNIPDASTLLPTPTGLEFIDTFVTASSTSSLSPVDDLNKQIYKRIYHNLPYLLKKKGTVEGLRTLISIYGIPDTVLRINEFGGKDKHPNTWDYWQNEYDYAFSTSGNGFITSSFILNSDWGAANNVPGAIEFRFKAESVPPTNVSQSLWYTDEGLGVFLEYTGPGLTTGSYLGSSINSNYQYGTLKFISGTNSSSVYLPFFDNGWWSVLVNSGSNGYELYAKNSIYSGNDGNTIGFQASSTLNISTLWSASSEIYFASSSATHVGFSGSLQEIRYYTQPITEDSFNAYVMNPNSIEQSQYLAFRASLGGELYTGSTSIHPSVTGSYITSSFSSNSTFLYSGTYNFTSNTEVNFYDQPAVGIKNAISNKIKQSSIVLPFTSNTDNNVPTNQTLSPFVSIQQNPSISSSYTRDVDYLEVAFSPQNEINEDIMDTFGYFNIGEYIGDPRQISSTSTSYPDLDTLRNEYFEKYTHNYNIWDYVRLIKYFDNSLFKMIRDWTPARTSLATGVVIKQHLLERNKYPVPQVEFTQSLLTASIDMYEVTASNAGGLNITSIVTQSWTGAHTSLSGSIPFTQNTEDEFFNGEFSGSFIEVTNGDLSDCNVTLQQVFNISPLSSTGDYIPSNPTFIPYLFNFDKTYYLSFTITKTNGLGANTPCILIDNTGKVLYSSPNLGIGNSVTVDKLEIKEVFPKLFFTSNPFLDEEFEITNFTVFESYIDLDCLVLEGNVLENRLNPFLMDVDYSYSQTQAVNQQQILTGSATRFAVPESNYTMLRSVNPRYNGSRNTGQYNYSQSYASSSIAPGYPIDQFTQFFAYFDWVGGSNPQYPGGGNTHIIYLINAETEELITLSEQNENLSTVSQVFKQGDTTYILPFSQSITSAPFLSTIVEGGALYNTILLVTGSQNPRITANTTLGSYSDFELCFNTSSLSILTDDDFFSNGRSWIYNFSNPSSSDGTINFFSFPLPTDSGSSIFNKTTGQLINVTTSPNTITYSDTYFPLQKYDFIRFGTTSSYNINNTASLDGTFEGGGIFQIVNIITGSNNNTSSSILINPLISTYPFTQNVALSSRDTQNFRIFRRIPNETFVLTNTIPYRGSGLLIPFNLNPKYNPSAIAKKLGL